MGNRGARRGNMLASARGNSFYGFLIVHVHRRRCRESLAGRVAFATGTRNSGTMYMYLFPVNLARVQRGTIGTFSTYFSEKGPTSLFSPVAADTRHFSSRPRACPAQHGATRCKLFVHISPTRHEVNGNIRTILFCWSFLFFFFRII